MRSLILLSKGLVLSLDKLLVLPPCKKLPNPIVESAKSGKDTVSAYKMRRRTRL